VSAAASSRGPRPRSADPYRDTEVIDSRAPRFNQAFIGTLALVAVLTGWWWERPLAGPQVKTNLHRNLCRGAELVSVTVRTRPRVPHRCVRAAPGWTDRQSVRR